MTTRRIMLAALLAAVAVPARAQDGGGGSPALYPDGNPYETRYLDDAEELAQRARREQRERAFREAEQRRQRAARERAQDERTPR